MCHIGIIENQLSKGIPKMIINKLLFLIPLFVFTFSIKADAASHRANVVLETTSPYHHIKVIDENGIRTLSFDGSMETKMSLENHLEGHFEYTEFFQMPWMWNNHIKNVLMIGLGGGSTQRAYQYYYPDVNVDTVELDSKVIKIAKEYFKVSESETHKLHNMDGRLYLRRSKKKFDVIIMDAYTSNRYGSFIPFHLATKEFFQMASDHLTDNGVVAYNVIGQMHGWRSDIMGALYKTMNEVFPQVYLFPSKTSQNVVMIATKSGQKFTSRMIRNECEELIKSGKVTYPRFRARSFAFTNIPPVTARRSPILTDDYAPTDGLLRTGER